MRLILGVPAFPGPPQILIVDASGHLISRITAAAPVPLPSAKRKDGADDEVPASGDNGGLAPPSDATTSQPTAAKKASNKKGRKR